MKEFDLTANTQCTSNQVILQARCKLLVCFYMKLVVTATQSKKHFCKN